MAVGGIVEENRRQARAHAVLENAQPHGALTERMKTAAGCLVRVPFPDGPRFLLVHPSGGYNRRAPWSIPKGELEPGERPEDAALRETREETGLECRIVAPLGETTYKKSRKRILAFLAEPAGAVPGPVLEPASWEVDRVEFLTDDEARARIHPDQLVFIERARANDGGVTP
jgi:8-oxo-dGTP pyrophosphatase MutT (NUDIX family)